MTPKSREAVFKAIIGKDYVKAVSCVDLTGDDVDRFVIRASVAILEDKGSHLLEAYLMEYFSASFQNQSIVSTDHYFEIISGIVAVIIHCNVFLYTEISCDRLLHRAYAIHCHGTAPDGFIPRHPAVTFSASVKDGNSSSCSSTGSTSDRNEDSFWQCLRLVLNAYQYTTPFLIRLTDHVLVSLRKYCTDSSQSQEFIGRFSHGSHFLPRSPQDTCPCPQHIIPIFLAACLNGWRRHVDDHSSTETSSNTSSSYSTVTEQVKEFWSIFARYPSQLYLILIDRFRFLSSSVVSNVSTDQLDEKRCMCQCHLVLWKKYLWANIACESGKYQENLRSHTIPEFDPRRTLRMISSKFEETVNRSVSPTGRKDPRHLHPDELLDAANFDKQVVVREGPNTARGMNVIIGQEANSQTSPQEQSGELDHSTSIWSLGMCMVPLQPEPEEIFRTDWRTRSTISDQSMVSMDSIDQLKLKDRKARFSEEVLLLQQRFQAVHDQYKSSSDRLVDDSDHDVESLTRTRSFSDTGTIERDWEATDEKRQIEDRATSPFLDLRELEITAVDTAAQTTHRVQDAGTAPEVTTYQDGHTSMEVTKSQNETQTETNLMPMQLTLIDRRQTQLLHVQNMTKRDVQYLFRSAQAFADIC